MKLSHLLLLLGLWSARSFAQGDLTPPGPPAPTMKSLDQIAPGTPLAGGTSTVTIGTPGSYYLTGNIAVTTSNGIVIGADNVTLDLNGFTVSSSAGTAIGSGILLSGDRSGVSLRHGHIQGTTTFDGTTFSGGGFANGISAVGTSPSWHVSAMSIVGVNYGISDNQNSVVVESCVVQTIRFYGIIGGTVAHCHVRDCGSGGIIARTASDCVAETRGGLNSIQASVATNCSGFNSTSGAGINALSVTGCFGQSDSGVGIAADVAQNSYGFSDSGIGLNANAATNCYGQSTSSNGIHANTATGCYGFSSLNRGISTDIATSCSGRCDTGVSFGINAAHIAISSYGYSSGGIGLASYIANSCRGENSGGPSTAASFKYNMP